MVRAAMTGFVFRFDLSMNSTEPTRPCCQVSVLSLSKRDAFRVPDMTLSRTVAGISNLVSLTQTCEHGQISEYCSSGSKATKLLLCILFTAEKLFYLRRKRKDFNTDFPKYRN